MNKIWRYLMGEIRESTVIQIIVIIAISYILIITFGKVL